MHIHSAIAKRFPSPEWAVLYEVRDDAGFKAHRSADVVAMNCWPSRGLRLHGLEVKSHRSDWLRELAKPEKSVAIQRFCDHWWLVTSDDKVATLDEIPERWGWLALSGKTLKTMRDAPALEAQPVTNGFLAALLRNATKGLVPSSTIGEQVQERLDDAVKRQRDTASLDLERLTKSYDKLRNAVEAFRESSGIDIFNAVNEYTYPRVDASRLGAVVKQVLSSDSPFGLNDLEAAKRNIQHAAERVDEMIEAVRGLAPASHEQKGAA
jgi:hypothetical protein